MIPETTSSVTGNSRRQEILDAAAELFMRRGYNGTTVQEIVDQVGLLKGSLYYYIRSKDDLLYEIIKEAHAGYLKNLELDVNDEHDPRVALCAFIRGHVMVAVHNATKAAVYDQDFKSLSPDRRDEIIQWRRQYEKHFRELVRGAAASEENSLSPGTLELSETMVLSALAAVHRWYRESGPLSADLLAEEVCQFALRALGFPSRS